MSGRLADASDVAAAIEALPAHETRFVGIDGFGGAGKTSLTARIAGLLRARGARVHIVHVDDFSALHLDEWDWNRLHDQLLAPLLAGRPARYQVWDWYRAAGGEWVDVEPGGVVLIEGVSATRSDVDVSWALTVWVDAPAELRKQRAIERDGAAMWPVWRDRWIPTELAYVARERPVDRVDFVVSGTSWTLGQ